MAARGLIHQLSQERPVVTSSRLLAHAVAATIAFTAAPAWATTALNGSVDIQALAVANGKTSQNKLRHKAWSLEDDGGPRKLSAKATSVADAKNIDATAQARIAARWDTADAGAVNATIGRTITKTKDQAPQLNVIPGAGWNYAFTVDEDSLFTLDFQLIGAGDLIGLGSWSLDILGPGPSLDETVLTDGFGAGNILSGSTTAHLLAGRTYSISLFNLDQNGQADGNDLDGSYRARFAWAITPDGDVSAAPEPATWALAIGGFGLVGSALRRRRGMSTTA